MPTLLNRARMSTATTGTGTVTLGSAVTGFLTFAEAGASNGVTYPYVIEDGNDFEIGVGTYTSSGTTFSRDTVTASKIGGTAGTSKIDLSGSATIFLTARATDILNPANNLSDVATPATAATNLGLGTGNTPQFTGIEVGHASDTTLTRASAGNLAVEGNALYRAGGTDVALADGGTGASLTDPDADRIMFWDDSAGAVAWLTAGTGLTITGTQIDAASSGGNAADQQVFTSSGTWTKPSGFGAKAYVLIQAWGAGGGGGRYSSTNAAGGGGGGGYSERWVLLSALGSTETVTIGAGGAGKSGSSGNGSAGGTTTFGSWVTAYGGGGGGTNTTGGGMGGNQNGAGTTATPFGYTDAASAIVYRLLDPFSGGNGKGSSNGAAGADAMRGGGGGAGASYTTGGVSQNGGNGGGGGASPSAGTQPGGGGGASSSGNVDGAAGAAGRVTVTVFDGA